MSTRFTVTLSDRLNRELEEAIGQTDESKTQALQKAVHLYLAVVQARAQGKKVGIANPGTELATEFIGL